MKKLLFISGLIIFAAVSFYASESCSGQSLELSLGLLKGDAYDCVMDLTQSVTQNIDGVEQRLDQRLIINWNYEVTGVGDDGIIDLRMTYQRIRINQDFGFNQSEYDSDNPPSYIEPSMRGYGALAGSILEISMDNKGSVIRLTGTDDLIDRMIEDIDLPDSPDRDRMLDGIRSQFGEKALTESIQQITSFYPPMPVAVGDEWSSETSIGAGFPMLILNRYILISKDGGLSIIKLESEITAGDDGAGIEIGSVNIFYDIAGAQNGIIEVDEASGLPVRSDIEMSFKGTVNISGLPDDGPQSWPIKANGRVVVTFEKK